MIRSRQAKVYIIIISSFLPSVLFSFSLLASQCKMTKIARMYRGKEEMDVVCLYVLQSHLYHHPPYSYMIYIFISKHPQRQPIRAQTRSAPPPSLRHQTRYLATLPFSYPSCQQTPQGPLFHPPRCRRSLRSPGNSHLRCPVARGSQRYGVGPIQWPCREGKRGIPRQIAVLGFQRRCRGERR